MSTSKIFEWAAILNRFHNAANSTNTLEIKIEQNRSRVPPGLEIINSPYGIWEKGIDAQEPIIVFAQSKTDPGHIYIWTPDQTHSKLLEVFCSSRFVNIYGVIMSHNDTTLHPQLWHTMQNLVKKIA